MILIIFKELLKIYLYFVNIDIGIKK